MDVNKIKKLRKELSEAKKNHSMNESAASAEAIQKIEEQLKREGCGTKRIND